MLIQLRSGDRIRVKGVWGTVLAVFEDFSLILFDTGVTETVDFAQFDIGNSLPDEDKPTTRERTREHSSASD